MINNKAAIFERLKEIWAEKQRVLSKTNQESSSSFIWFDPVNNDPHFIKLMSSILESEDLYFDTLATLRSNFQWTGKGHFVKFMPSSISLRLASGGKAIKLVVGLIYIPCLIRALLVLVFSGRPAIISTGLWFPILDGIMLKCLKYLGIPFHVLVHRPYRVGKKITRGMKIFYNPQYNYIVLSKFCQQFLFENYNVPKCNINILRHPNFNIEFNRILPIKALKDHLTEWQKERSLFLYMSGITFDHGIMDFVAVIRDCLGKYPYCFMICGNPKNSEQMEISERIKSEFCKTEAVKCNFSFYSNEQAKTWLSVADAVVLPYREIVQSGVQALALGQGVPVIIRDVGGLAEDVVNGWNGVVLKENTVDEWQKALASIHSGVADRKEIIKHSEKLSGDKTTTELLKGYLEL